MEQDMSVDNFATIFNIQHLFPFFFPYRLSQDFSEFEHDYAELPEKH